MPWIIKQYALTTLLLVILAWAESFSGHRGTGVFLAALSIFMLALTLLLYGKWQNGDWR